MSPRVAIALFAGVWLGCSLGGGAALAFLARRIHPSLSFRRLWIFYSGLLAFTVAAVLAIAWW